MPSRWAEPLRRVGPWMRTLRRAFHQDPELSFEERRTQERVLSALADAGIEGRRVPASTGVLATIAPHRRGPAVALRADMDALPVLEATRLPFRSKNPGAMHACGHDLHLAMLLGAARVLHEHEDRLGGPVRLVFQPAEEHGTVGGAKGMIEAGALEIPRLRAVLAQHVEPHFPVGAVALRPGPMMAAADNFEITVEGRAGHGGYPHLGPDAVLLAAEVIVGLQALVSRSRNPVEPAVITVGSIHGGTRPNILPSEVVLQGTVRTFSPTLRSQLAKAIPHRARGIAESLGGSVRVKYVTGYPAVVNNVAVTQGVAAAFGAAWGPRRVLALADPVMGAEDFSWYLERVPGSFWFLGVAPPGRSAGLLHSDRCRPDERALGVGAEALVLAVEAVQRGVR